MNHLPNIIYATCIFLNMIYCHSKCNKTFGSLHVNLCATECVDWKTFCNRYLDSVYLKPVHYSKWYQKAVISILNVNPVVKNTSRELCKFRTAHTGDRKELLINSRTPQITGVSFLFAVISPLANKGLVS